MVFTGLVHKKLKALYDYIGINKDNSNKNVQIEEQ